MPVILLYAWNNVECLYNTDIRIYIDNTGIDDIVSCFWVNGTNIKQK